MGNIAPTPGLVDEYFNDSTGVGDEGETDARGPWNTGGKWKIVEAPELGRPEGRQGERKLDIFARRILMGSAADTLKPRAKETQSAGKPTRSTSAKRTSIK